MRDVKYVSLSASPPPLPLDRSLAHPSLLTPADLYVHDENALPRFDPSPEPLSPASIPHSHPFPADLYVRDVKWFTRHHYAFYNQLRRAG